jgi:hypothetical protein
LQPVDTDRLLVSRIVLEADIDIVARLQHLLGGLGEARLVAVGHRQRGDAGQVHRETEGDEKRGRPARLHRQPTECRRRIAVQPAEPPIHLPNPRS